MNVYALVPLLSVLVYAVLLHLASRHPRRRERGAFGWYLTAAAVWSLASFVLHVDEPVLNRYALVESRLLIIAFISMVAAYYIFVRAFVSRDSGPGLRLAYASIPLIALLAALGWLPRDAHTTRGILEIDHGWTLYLLAAAAMAMAGHAFAMLANHRRSLPDPEARNRTAYLLIGLSVLVVTSLTNLSASLAKYPIDHLGNLINALIITYVIRRYRLLEIKFVLRRRIVYTLSTVVLGAAYLLLLFSFYRALFRWSDQWSGLLVILVALALAALFAPLRNFAEEHVERLFFRDTYRYRQLMLDFTNQLSRTLELEDVSQATLRTTTEALGAQWAGLLLQDHQSGDYRLQFTHGLMPSGEGQELRLRKEDPLLPWLAERTTALRAEALEALPVAKGTWAEERKALRHYQVSVLCPIIYGRSLSSLLAVGPRTDDTPYKDEHLEFLMTMANGLGVVMENARTMDSLRNQQRRTEQLLVQVVAAQEEERQRIAGELHDGIAQHLVRLYYQVQIISSLLAKSNGADIQGELQRIEEVLDGSIKEVRRVLVGLRPPDLEHLGLLKAIEREAQRFNKEGGNCSWELLGSPPPLPSTVETTIFRVVQEAFNNVRKHAEADQVWLKVDCQDRQITVEVRDDGKGFDVSRTLEQALAGGHMGLWGMKQRAEALGAAVTIQSTPDYGTTVRMVVPLEAPATVAR